MPDKAARTATNPSNRAKAKDAADRKVVYRSVLDNPFRIQWPSTPLNLQNSILARVVDMAGAVSEYHLGREKGSRKRKRAQKGSKDREAKRQHVEQRAVQPANIETDNWELGTRDHPIPTSLPTSGPSGETHSEQPAQPEILQYLTIGINEVTKVLEKTVRSFRQTVTADDPLHTKAPSDHDARLILICRGDVDPPILIQHIPHLVAACNSRIAIGPSNGTWLIPLPKGAESSLAEALGLRRVSVVAIDGSAPDFGTTFMPLLEDVPLLRASWLTPQPGQIEALVPTYIKQLRTTAPKDMKAAKEQRARGRAAAKERRGRKKAELPRRTIAKTVVPGA